MDETTADVKQQIQEKLLSYLSSLENGIDSVIEFSSDQIPIVLEEFLKWGAYESIACATFYALMLLMIFVFYIMGIFYSKNFYEERMSGVKDYSLRHIFRFITTLAMMCSIGHFSFMIYRQFLVYAKIDTAPRIYLIEELSKLVNQ